MIVLSKQELEEKEKIEYEVLKANMNNENYKYNLGRWGMIRELIEALEDNNE